MILNRKVESHNGFSMPSRTGNGWFQSLSGIPDIPRRDRAKEGFYVDRAGTPMFICTSGYSRSMVASSSTGKGCTLDSSDSRLNRHKEVENMECSTVLLDQVRILDCAREIDINTFATYSGQLETIPLGTIHDFFATEYLEIEASYELARYHLVNIPGQGHSIRIYRADRLKEVSLNERP